MKTRYAMLLSTGLVLTSGMAAAEMVVIVSSKNANSALNMDQTEKLFLGKINAFPDGSTAIPMDLPKGTERDTFYSNVTGKNSSQLKAYWSKQVFTGSGQPPKETESSQEMVNLVGKNPNLLGYIDKAAVNSSVKILLSIP
jgi:ABC-type phosphate transport system substrate-binding protein